MTGYKPGKRIYALTFDEFPGLVVRAVSTNLGKLFDLGNTSIKVIEADPEKRMATFNTFAKCIVEWNIVHPEPEDLADYALVLGTVQDAEALVGRLESGVCARCGLREDEPMSVTADAMLCLDLDFLMKLIMGWMEATSSVVIPKGLNLTDGGMNTPEDPTQRLAAMQNPVTFPTPN